MESGEIVARWQEVLERMRSASIKSGRGGDACRLVAVSKLHGPEVIRVLYDCGQRMFGENYVQEAHAKMAVLPRDVAWHFLGHLQTNKVKNVVGLFELIHGVDSIKLAQSLQKRALEQGCVQDVLVQVNLGGEAQKNGIRENDLPRLAEFLLSASSLRWRGLMLMPPFFDDPERARPFFARLRDIASALRRDFSVPLQELSMGMTGDFEAAIEEGATLVRVGTRIFGDRP